MSQIDTKIIMTNPCMKYESNKMPFVDEYKYENDQYPHIWCLDPCYSKMFLPIIEEHCLDRERYVSVTLRKDDNYIQNKFIISVIYLQYDYINEFIDTATIGTFKICMYVLTSFYTYYHYCVNTDKYLAICSLLLNRMESFGHVNQYIDQWIKNIRKHDYEFDNVRINWDKLSNCKFKCVNDSQSMILLLNEYYHDSDDEKKCKYCLSSLPEDRLVHPCKCTNPVHIECFKKWFLMKEKKNVRYVMTNILKSMNHGLA